MKEKDENEEKEFFPGAYSGKKRLIGCGKSWLNKKSEKRWDSEESDGGDILDADSSDTVGKKRSIVVRENDDSNFNGKPPGVLTGGTEKIEKTRRQGCHHYGQSPLKRLLWDFP